MFRVLSSTSDSSDNSTSISPSGSCTWPHADDRSLSSSDLIAPKDILGSPSFGKLPFIISIVTTDYEVIFLREFYRPEEFADLLEELR